MNRRNRVGASTAALVLGLSLTPEAASADHDSPELLQRMQQMEATIDRLNKQVVELGGAGESWLTEQRAAELRTVIQDMLADAEMRASLRGSGLTAGYDDGFTIGSADGNFFLRINGQLQSRWVYNRYATPERVRFSPGSHEEATHFRRGGGVDPRPAFDIDAFKEWSFAPTAAGGLGYPNPDEFVTIRDVVETLIPEVDWDDADAAAEILDVDPFVIPFVLGAELDILTDEEIAPNIALVIDAYRVQLAQAALQADRHRSGFEAARTKLFFSGHVVNPQWQYHIEGDFSRSGGGFRLLDAYAAYDFGNGFRAQMGQFKAPLLREELVDSRYQQAIERSLVNSFFTAGRSQGVMLSYEADLFRLHGSYNDGANRLNSPWNAYDTEYSLTFRGELMLAGEWDQFAELRSLRGESYAVLVGAAVHWQEDEYGTGGFGPEANDNEIESLTVTADVSLKFGGANLFGAFAYRQLDPKFGSTLDQWGFLVQGGYHFTERLEAFVRYEWAHGDWPDLQLQFAGRNLTVYSFDDLSILTWGVNYYTHGHQVKFTADMGYAFERVEFPFADGRAGWRSDTGGRDGQFLIRTQLQLLF